MQHSNKQQKQTQNHARNQSNEAAAGKQGAALAPPSYGMAFLDAAMDSHTSGQPLQLQSESQSSSGAAADAPPVNRTGLPDKLKAGIESLSGMSMDHVRVHYNSDKPAKLQAHAYAQGSEIHLAAGQEQHLPHEAWHVVQQAQGRVKPTLQMKGGININDNRGLEAEADTMGMRAVLRDSRTAEGMTIDRGVCNVEAQGGAPVQRESWLDTMREFLAGASGYAASYVRAPSPIPSERVAADPNRAFFHHSLTMPSTIPPVLSQQWLWQNAMQAYFGNRLPLPAASAMLEGGAAMGTATTLQDHLEAHRGAQMNSLGPERFDGRAPWLLHHLAIPWQTPTLIAHYLSGRSAQAPDATGAGQPYPIRDFSRTLFGAVDERPAAAVALPVALRAAYASRSIPLPMNPQFIARLLMRSSRWGVVPAAMFGIQRYLDEVER